jgi:shikimate kinase
MGVECQRMNISNLDASLNVGSGCGAYDVACATFLVRLSDQNNHSRRSLALSISERRVYLALQ